MKRRVLDMESLVLHEGAHSNHKEMCVMEAVAYVAGEPWTDSPDCASPVITAFLRLYNDSVDDETRQTLKPFILQMVGTSASSEVESRRSTIACDWLVRVHASAWLRLAGLTSEADALANLPEIVDFASTLSIKAPLELAQKNAAAARAAAGAAARAAARDAAGDAAWAALRPTLLSLQGTIPSLIQRMIDAGASDAN